MNYVSEQSQDHADSECVSCVAVDSTAAELTVTTYRHLTVYIQYRQPYDKVTAITFMVAVRAPKYSHSIAPKSVKESRHNWNRSKNAVA